MKTTFLYVSLFAFTIMLTSCGAFRSTVTIPAQQEFVLGERAGNYKAELKNLSDETVDVVVLDKETKEQTQGFGLAANGKTKVSISKNEVVLLKNKTDKDLQVRAKFNKGVEGMRYQAVDSGKKN